ncbi:hypothetical protein [Burkholderia pyrrocinia]|uniref:hypothetical protein n=1 Tax=Burkholderia pyrrocinia TaxID=60550 RepID=UPI001588A860|nr:hypothetical protein [Burkholderia pyrrocinia]
MYIRFRSLLLTFAISAACAGIVASLNLMLAAPEQPQPPWVIEFHVACAFVGAFAAARFIQGTPSSLQGPTSRSTVAQGVVMGNRVGTVNFVVPGNSAFFSPARCVMILCFVLCLMAQFIQVGKVTDGASGSPAGGGSQMRRLST